LLLLLVGWLDGWMGEEEEEEEGRGALAKETSFRRRGRLLL
jgi:hypothetical protein